MQADVSVETSRCQGHGFCERLAPQVFEVGMDDALSRVVVPTVSGALLESALRAQAACPEEAISVGPPEADTR